MAVAQLLFVRSMMPLVCLLLLATSPVGSPVKLEAKDIVGTWHRSQDDCFYYLDADFKCLRRYADTGTSGHWKFVPPGRLQFFLDPESMILQITGYEKHIMHLRREDGTLEVWLRVEQ